MGYFDIRAQANSASDGEIMIFGNIIDRHYWEGDKDNVTPKDFDKALKELGAGLKNLTIRVNSYGGSVFAGQAIATMIDTVKRRGVQVTAVIEGIAASMGSVIPQAAHKVHMADNAMMMIHKPSSIAWGNANEMRDTADMLDKTEKTLIALYMRRFTGTEDELKDLLKGEVDGTWMTADEALGYGLVDEVDEPVEMAACAGGYMFNGIQVSASALKGAEDKIQTYEKIGGENGMVIDEKIDAKIKSLLDEGKAVAVTPDEKAEGGYVVSEVLEGVLEATEDFLTAEAAHDALGEDVSGENILALLGAAKEAGATLDAVLGAVKNIGQEPQADPEQVAKAKAYDTVVEAAKTEAHKNAVRAMGEKYDKERVDKILGVFDYTEILAQSEEWAEAGAEALHMGQGRVSVTPDAAKPQSEIPDDLYKVTR